MVRRASSETTGYYLPQLRTGLVASYSRFWDRVPSMGGDLLDAMERGERVLLDGAVVWSALHALDSEQASWFQRVCGGRSTREAAFRYTDGTRWIYDPRTARLTRLSDEEKL